MSKEMTEGQKLAEQLLYTRPHAAEAGEELNKAADEFCEGYKAFLDNGKTVRDVTTYTVKLLGNVVEGRPVKYLNLPVEDLKAAAIAQMQDGQPVWFGCDVGKCSLREGGVLADIAPTMLKLLGLEQPAEMTGRSIIE